MTARVVPRLQRDPPLYGLDIREARFRLDAASPTWPGDDGVPCPQVPIQRERHLGPPTEARMDARSESVEDGKLRAVTDGIARRIGAQGQVEADDGAVGTDEFEARVGDLTPLEAADAGVRAADCRSDLRLAQAGADPSTATVGADRGDLGSASPPAAVGGTFARWHRGGSSQMALHYRLPASLRTPGVPSDRRGAFRSRESAIPSSSGTPGERDGRLRLLHRSLRALGVQATTGDAGTQHGGGAR